MEKICQQITSAAEVDHRGSGTDRRISCETSSKTPSATHPPAPLATPFTMRERSYSCKSQWNSVDHTCTKNSWNPIYNAEPIRDQSEDDPTTHETVSHPSHRRGRSSTFGDGLCMEKHRVSCICYLSKTHFVRDFLQNSIGNSSTSTTCNPIYNAGTILQLQITMEFCRPHMHEKQLKPHLQCGTDPRPIRDQSEDDPTTHETVSHPSHRRGRSSRFGDRLCMEKHRGFLHLLSLKNAFCARLPPKLHRQLIHQHHLQPHLQCGNDPTVANHNGILSTTHARKTVETPFTMRNRSETNPRMIRPHTRPSRTRRTAEVDHRGSGTDFVWKNIGVSCICYLSKTHFVRDFLQNSIGNSSTSTTCNPIYNAGTILQLQITMEFCRPHMHEKQLKPHLQCGTDPRPIRGWSDHTRDRLAPVAPQR